MALRGKGPGLVAVIVGVVTGTIQPRQTERLQKEPDQDSQD